MFSRWFSVLQYNMSPVYSPSPCRTYEKNRGVKVATVKNDEECIPSDGDRTATWQCLVPANCVQQRCRAVLTGDGMALFHRQTLLERCRIDTGFYF